MSTPGVLEGRPSRESASPVQALIDAAAPGATVVIRAGTYDGDLLIDRPIHLKGEGRPILRGSGGGSVLRVRADDVTIEGFEIDGRGGGDLGRDSSGVHITGHRVVVRDCAIRNALFGIYLREANGARVERTTIVGIRNKAAGEKGSGIHVWNTDGFTLIGNDVTDVRDGFYIQSSPNGVVSGNAARDLRYGLHYMFSDDNVFEDNRFENGAAGAALMYSSRLTFRRNRFVHNRGFASVGLLLKTCEDVLAEGNLMADNARGLFVEGSTRNTFVRQHHRRVRRGAGAVRLERGHPVRGQRLRRQSVAAAARRPPHGHGGRPATTGRITVNRISTATASPTARIVCRTCSITCAGISPRPICSRRVWPRDRSASRSARSPCWTWCPSSMQRPLASPPALPDVPTGLSGDSARSPVGLGLSGTALALGVWGWSAGRRGRRFHPAAMSSRPAGAEGTEPRDDCVRSVLEALRHARRRD